MDIDKAMEAKGFSYLPSEGGWKKHKLFVADEMLEDHPTQEFIEKMTWLADSSFEFVSNPEKTMLFVHNGVVTMDFMVSLDYSLKELQKEVKEESKKTVTLN